MLSFSTPSAGVDWACFLCADYFFSCDLFSGNCGEGRGFEHLGPGKSTSCLLYHDISCVMWKFAYCCDFISSIIWIITSTSHLISKDKFQLFSKLICTLRMIMRIKRVFIKHLEPCLVHSKCFINTDSFCFHNNAELHAIMISCILMMWKLMHREIK